MSKPSLAQRLALKRAAEADGVIRRTPGGFWISGNLSVGPDGTPRTEYTQKCSEAWCDIRTVRALENHGWVERSFVFPGEWRDSRKLTEAGRAVV